MKVDGTIQKAKFDPKVCSYWLLSGAFSLAVTIVGIPLLLFWFPLGLFFTRRYLDRMDCVLTEKSLRVSKGILVRVEKTIPLEKITDMGMVQGPVMRAFNLHKLTVETAGQSGPGALVSLTGIVDAKEFRQAVLNQRDAVSSASFKSPSQIGSAEISEDKNILLEIRDTLLRIEDKLGSGTGQ